MAKIAPADLTSLESSGKHTNKTFLVRSLVAFWIFGICNNFAFVVMLSAAQDILSLAGSDKGTISATNATKADDVCIPTIDSRTCNKASVGIVLFMNIIPQMIVKAVAPFFIDYLPFGIRHILTVITMMSSLTITAFATSIPVALIGVSLASVSSGFGEISYLTMAAHYSANTISTWSSGTGMAGVIGAAAYAALTDSNMLNLSPKATLLIMNLAPLTLAFVYTFLLERTSTFKKTELLKPSTWLNLDPHHTETEKSKIKEDYKISIHEQTEAEQFNVDTNLRQKIGIIKGLLKFMVPFGTSYFTQYFINQGLAELIVFDCSKSFHSSPGAQYRWYQVLFQVGVFFSRSSINLIQMPYWAFASMPILQLIFATTLFLQSLSPFIPHIGVVYAIILLTGLAGGWSYVNTIHYIHKHIGVSIKEFCMVIISSSGSVGVLLAAIIAIPVHNAICSLPYFSWFS